MGRSDMRQVMSRAIAITLLTAITTAACAGSRESETCFVWTAYEPHRGPPTERMVDLARLLGGGDSDSAVFSEKELGHAREIRFFPGLDPYSHPSHFDQLADPKDCAVRRTFLNQDGGVHRTESLSLPCDEYWELVAWIDGYYESRGSLPTSQTDLQVLAMEFRTEEGPCSQ